MARGLVAFTTGVLLLSLPAAPRVAFAIDSSAPIARYRTDLFREEQGFDAGGATVIAQTADGSLWVGSERGLVRFDGTRFVRLSRRQAPELPSKSIVDLANAPDGSLVVVTPDGLLRWSHGAFGAEPTSELHASRFCGLVGRDGTLWVGSTGAGVLRRKDGATRVLTSTDGLPSDSVWALHEDAAGAIWAATDHGAARLEDGGARVTVFGTAQGLPAPDAFMFASEGTSLFVGTSRGIARLDAGVQRFETIASLPARTLYGARDGGLWIGSDEKLWRLAPGRSAPELVAKLGSNVLAIFEDAEGSLWVGTESSGLARLRDSRVETISRADGLTVDPVQCVIEDHDGAIWLGTRDGLWLRRAGTSALERFDESRGLRSAYVNSLAVDRSGALWVATSRGIGTLRDGLVRRWWSGAKDGLDDDAVSLVFVDSRDRVWVAMEGVGVRRLEHDRFVKVAGLAPVEGHLAFHAAEDTGGSIWISTQDAGVFQLRDGAVSHLSRESGLASDAAGGVLVDADGTAWIATDSGLTRVGANGRVATVSSVEGLPDDDVGDLVDDGRGDLWLALSAGIVRVARKELDAFAAGSSPVVHARLLGRADGLLSAMTGSYDSPGAWRMRDGRLLFATAEGAVIVDPAALGKSPPPPPAQVDEIRADHVPQPPAPPVDVVRPRLLEVDYHATTLLAPERIRYRYRLEGYDPSWVEAGDSRTATWTNVPPGRYRFHASACNEDGDCNDAGATLEIVVHAGVPATLRLLAAFGCGVAVALGGVFALRRRPR